MHSATQGSQCDTVGLGDLERSVVSGSSDGRGEWGKYDVYLGNFGSASNANSGTVQPPLSAAC